MLSSTYLPEGAIGFGGLAALLAFGLLGRLEGLLLGRVIILWGMSPLLREFGLCHCYCAGTVMDMADVGRADGEGKIRGNWGPQNSRCRVLDGMYDL